MPYPITCPTCSTDGTESANEIIARHSSETPPAPESPAPLRIAHHAPVADAPLPASSRGVIRDIRLGLVDREQAKHEARCKVMWGDTPEAVINYLMVQGFTHPEASELVQELFTERRAEVRSNGIRKIAIGSGMISVPIAAFIFFLSIKFMPIKIMGAAIAVGLWGIWLLLNGIIMVVAPKMESGDVADQ
ncbi:MAG TPA: hypothetical protein VGO57_08385 [Verrucomicrobiae bacterium]